MFFNEIELSEKKIKNMNIKENEEKEKKKEKKKSKLLPSVGIDPSTS